MVSEYYLLVLNYQSQDATVLLAFAFACLLWAGWLIVRRFQFQWLDRFYVAQALALWVGLLFAFSPIAAPLLHP